MHRYVVIHWLTVGKERYTSMGMDGAALTRTDMDTHLEHDALHCTANPSMHS